MKLLSSHEFQRVQRQVAEWAGIYLSDAKLQLATNRLGRQLVAHGLSRYKDLLDKAESDLAVRQSVINALTTNVTSFFRERHHFETLRELVRTWHRDASSAELARGINIWSAGCSTGEESVSLAITLSDLSRELGKSLRFSVLATDIDTVSLATAKQATYGLKNVECIEAQIRTKYFTEAEPQRWKVKPELLSLIDYRAINLNSASWNLPAKFLNEGLDYIFCRNVMIYFTAPTQRILLERFSKCLRPRAYLFAGHSEMLLHSNDLLESVGRTVYRSRRLI